jgi:hypothetical protein
VVGATIEAEVRRRTRAYRQLGAAAAEEECSSEEVQPEDFEEATVWDARGRLSALRVFTVRLLSMALLYGPAGA